MADRLTIEQRIDIRVSEQIAKAIPVLAEMIQRRTAEAIRDAKRRGM